jgi:hypothetical protein
LAAFGTRAKYWFDQVGDRVGVEVADDHQRRILRHVIGLVEVAHVVDRRRVQVGHAADGRVLVGMHVKGVGGNQLVQ